MKSNVQHRGGFLGMLAGLAAKEIPTLLGGLACGLVSGAVEKAVGGRGLYLHHRDDAVVTGCTSINPAKRKWFATDTEPLDTRRCVRRLSSTMEEDYCWDVTVHPRISRY